MVDDKGKFGDANQAVIAALTEAGALIARARRKHDYPHSWRSKKPVIFRATPQWFIALDKPVPFSVPLRSGQSTLRARALAAIADTRWVPPQGENRITGMVETRPDWVVSRQRAWGVPITVFRHKETGEVIPRADFRLLDRADRESILRLPRRRRRCLVQARGEGTLPDRPGRRSCGLGQGRRHSRRLVRFGLDPRFRSGEATRSDMAGRALSRRLRPASRLVPVLAA